MAISDAALVWVGVAGAWLVLALSYVYWFFFVREPSSVTWKMKIECEVVDANGELPWFAGSLADHADQIREQRARRHTPFVYTREQWHDA